MAAGFKTATVASGDVPSTQTDFPSYVDLSRLGITTLAEAQSVRVYADSGKTTEWAREIVSATEMHVKVPSLTNTVSMYVDWDGVRADLAVTDTYGRNAVWSDYNTVYHMLDVNDSTASGQTLTNNGSVSFANDAKIGKGSSGFVANSSVNLARSSVTTIGTGAFSYTGWVMATSLSTGTNKAIHSHTSDVDSLLVGYLSSSLTWYSGGYRITGSTTLSANTWYHYALIGNGAGAGSRNVKVYLNGVEDGSYTADYNLALTNVKFGAHVSASSEGFINGNLDEKRKMLGTALSANWLVTEYNNQSDEAGFWGTWSDVGGGGNTTNFFALMTA